MNLAYVRVSTVEQNEERQIEGLKPRKIDKWYIEKKSGKDMNRKQFQLLLAEAKPGDTIFVHDFSRFARSTVDLLVTVKKLNEKGIHVVSNKEGFDTSTATGELMLSMIAAINQFERRNTLERQREGIEIAKRKGVYKDRCGRKQKCVDRELLNQYLDSGLSKAAISKALGISRPTLYRILEEQEESHAALSTC